MIGLQVVAVPAEGSAGQKAGIYKDDFIIGVDGENIETVDQLIELMTEKAGTLVNVELLRGQIVVSKVIEAGTLGINLVPEIVDGLLEKVASRQDALKAEPHLLEVILTTAPYVETRPVVETLDIVSAECVIGMNVFKDVFVAVRDMVGGRSKAYQNALGEAKQECLMELRKIAVSLNANAVIGVSLNYSEISGSGKSMLFLVATGTAVKLSP
ncbi:heavy metal-binding domain-containing protein [Neptuniibacter marinus]|uniref:heavy metal-binding domain-containing protein n=1 Tax=Neptuniibacter marinus TaxID=1806670 RepID=UPI000AA3D6D2|nr:heavy metal-binding domain-containing protein [Neptuniibacter marinus]